MISFLRGCFTSTPVEKTPTQQRTLAKESPLTTAFKKVVKDDIDVVNDRVHYLRCELGYRVRRVDFHYLVHSLHDAVEKDNKLVAFLVDQTFRVVASTQEMLTKMDEKPKALLGKSISTILSSKDAEKFKHEDFTPIIANVAFESTPSKAFYATVYRLQYGSYYVAMLDVDKTSKHVFEQQQRKFQDILFPHEGAGDVEKMGSLYYDSTEYEIAPKKGLEFQSVIAAISSSEELVNNLVFVCSKHLEIVALNEKARDGIGSPPTQLMNTKLTEYMTSEAVMRLTSALRSEKQNPGKVYKEFQAWFLSKGNEEFEVSLRWGVIGNDYFLISLKPQVSFSIELSTPEPTAWGRKPDGLHIEIPGTLLDDDKRKEGKEGKEGLDSKDRDTPSCQMSSRILLSRSFDFPSVMVSQFSLGSGASNTHSPASSNASSLASTPNLTPEKEKRSIGWPSATPRLPEPPAVIVNEISIQ